MIAPPTRGSRTTRPRRPAVARADRGSPRPPERVVTGWRRTLAIVVLAIGGLVLAAGLTTAASTLSGQSVGLSSEPLSAGESLAPSETATPSPSPRPTRTATPRPRRTRTPRPTSTPAPTRTAVPTVDDDNSGEGGDDSRRSRARARTRPAATTISDRRLGQPLVDQLDTRAGFAKAFPGATRRLGARIRCCGHEPTHPSRDRRRRPLGARRRRPRGGRHAVREAPHCGRGGHARPPPLRSRPRRSAARSTSSAATSPARRPRRRPARRPARPRRRPRPRPATRSASRARSVRPRRRLGPPQRPDDSGHPAATTTRATTAGGDDSGHHSGGDGRRRRRTAATAEPAATMTDRAPGRIDPPSRPSRCPPCRGAPRHVARRAARGAARDHEARAVPRDRRVARVVLRDRRAARVPDARRGRPRARRAAARRRRDARPRRAR